MLIHSFVVAAHPTHVNALRELGTEVRLAAGSSNADTQLGGTEERQPVGMARSSKGVDMAADELPQVRFPNEPASLPNRTEGG